MPDLDPAHVEAVAQALAAADGERPSEDEVDAVLLILTSTDPAVHAAILAVPAVREALANAWDEGWRAATEVVDFEGERVWAHQVLDGDSTNPYYREEPRCQFVTQTPWGPAQCALPADHSEPHAYSPSEAQT